MDMGRVNREVVQASQQFEYVELHRNSSGELYVKTVLQAASQMYIAGVFIPEEYPNRLPKIFILKPTIATNSPHKYDTGNICYMHYSKWNPGIHNLTFVIARAAKWLSKYEVWKNTGSWPGASMSH